MRGHKHRAGGAYSWRGWKDCATTIAQHVTSEPCRPAARHTLRGTTCTAQQVQHTHLRVRLVVLNEGHWVEHGVRHIQHRFLREG